MDGQATVDSAESLSSFFLTLDATDEVAAASLLQYTARAPPVPSGAAARLLQSADHPPPLPFDAAAGLLRSADALLHNTAAATYLAGVGSATRCRIPDKKKRGRT